MQYAMLKSLKAYTSEDTFHVPKGKKIGFGNVVYLLTPSQKKSLKLLEEKRITYSDGLFKYYFIDTRYNKKIGNKRVKRNDKVEVMNNFKKCNFPKTLRLLTKYNKKAYIDKEKNILHDMGGWMDLYFTHSYKTSIKVICAKFIDFLFDSINASEYASYNKILYIPIPEWFTETNTKFGYTKKLLNNPLSILILAIYKYPQLFNGGTIENPVNRLKDFTLIFHDYNTSKLLKIDGSDFIQSNYTKIRSKVLSFNSITSAASLEDMEEIENEPVSTIDDLEIGINSTAAVVATKVVSTPIKKTEVIKPIYKPVPSIKPIQSKPEVLKSEPIKDASTHKTMSMNSGKSSTHSTERLKNNVRIITKKRFLGNDVNDITKKIDPLDIDSDIEIQDTELSNSIDTAIDDYFDTHEEIDETSFSEEDEVKIMKTVKEKVLRPRYVPQKSEKVLKKIEQLAKIQETILLPHETLSMVESKIIEEEDLSAYINTSNTDLTTAKYKNFEKAYNQKKLESDIDNAVAILSQAQYKIFITGKEEEDTSDKFNLKKTLTYRLQDEVGRKHTLKFDIPILIENRFLYINGNKFIINNQFILNPIVKTGPDVVQLVSIFIKMFIYRRGIKDATASNLKTYIMKESTKFNVKVGNVYIVNKEYPTPLDMDLFAKQISEFSIGKWRIILDVAKMYELIKEKDIDVSKIDMDTKIPIGYNVTTRELLTVTVSNDDDRKSFSEEIMDIMDEVDIKQITKKNIAKRLMYNELVIMDKAVPLILFLLYCDGFTETMKKAKINYDVFNPNEVPPYNKNEKGVLILTDKVVLWDRKPLQNSLLMNGLNMLKTITEYSIDDLNEQTTYVNILTEQYEWSTIAYSWDQYKDFMIDSITREVLMDYKLPLTLTELMIYANQLLTTTAYENKTPSINRRLRNNELIAEAVYTRVTSAYIQYRKTQHKKNPTKISVSLGEIMTAIKSTSLLENTSSLNPILEIEKLRSVTTKGERGNQLDESYSLEKRAYDDGMVGIVGISTSPDAGVGIVRQLTLEPNITSTRGYMDITPIEDIDNLTSANLLTPAELITPMGVTHDDGARTAMAYKQSKYMVLTEESSPVLVGNKFESVIPYYLSKDFIVTAEEDGKVIDIDSGIMIVEYKSGKKEAIELDLVVKKNASSGFYIDCTMVTTKAVGDKVTKGEVIAHESKAFTKNDDDLSASLNLGNLIKVAILPNYDLFEDSVPITSKLANMSATFMTEEKKISLIKETAIDFIASVGDRVEAGDPLIKFDENRNDPDVGNIAAKIREILGEDIVESFSSTIHAKHSGEIVDIKIAYTSDINEMSPSLQKIVKAYIKKVKKKEAILEKYKNPDDYKYYKCGYHITESAERVKPDALGKVDGTYLPDGIIIKFYIRYKDIGAKGDKYTHEAALKGICSHVIPEGLEAYSEFEPDEEISSFLAPFAIEARKTVSVIPMMFANKVIIYLKRLAKEMYLEEDQHHTK